MAYNRGMVEKKVYDKKRRAAQIIFTLALALWLAFIFGNSLRTGESSSKQSSTVVDCIQTAVGWIAPDSYLATATGAAYQRIHNVVRKIAHFTEFALLGALACGCYFSYTSRRKWAWIPCVALAIVPVADESLQLFRAGRAFGWGDVVVDCCGGYFGFAVGCLLVFCIKRLRQRRKAKKEEGEKNGEG